MMNLRSRRGTTALADALRPQQHKLTPTLPFVRLEVGAILAIPFGFGVFLGVGICPVVVLLALLAVTLRKLCVPRWDGGKLGGCERRLLEGIAPRETAGKTLLLDLQRAGGGCHLPNLSALVSALSVLNRGVIVADYHSVAAAA